MEQYILSAACACQTGRLRTNNEDNFYFDGRCLEVENKGLRHPVTMRTELRREVCLAVFDGIGGEDFGEIAAFTAAQGMRLELAKLDDYIIPERRFLQEMCSQLNALVRRRREELHTGRMGTTMAALLFSQDYVYVCNLGDSRAYRLRNGEFLQLSQDHVQRAPEEKKGPLTRFLGMESASGAEPYIAKGQLERGDWYLICSDGLTDALTNLEIDHILLHSPDPEQCVRSLTEQAQQNGARDNVTAIAVYVSGQGA